MDVSVNSNNTPPPALDDALVMRLFGEAGLKYLQNKHRGGTNGKKGTRYEDQFAAFKIAEILAEHVEHPEPLPVIEEQAFGFVDDLAIASQRATKYYQCKNSDSVSWTGGDHPIETDFKSQVDLASALQKPAPAVQLVVADSDLAAKLGGKIPAQISEHSSVEFFPFFGSVNQLVLSHPPLREKLAALTRVENPKDDELEATFSALLLAWVRVLGGSSVEEIVQSARKQSPQLLRVFPLTDGVEFLQQAFKDALARIPGLSYSVKRGFFSWNADGVSVTLERDCASEEFGRFQQRVINAKPNDIDAFWDLMP
ncbi:MULTISPECIES: hypothetical protein [unclassified Caballeronia]|uniref:hypothetical protein n=1 Tax=unclassified Caballeronia TaxID=2646786 RepID=UPI001F3A5901|nr:MULTISPECIES: hypothetical protein [unclassified Caballeronia]MCE4543270.1 hypothetical protein [Caballeronia sp. PC1]MCE4567674.1 hypothetical protein [Caballeronia sp. CLC5]